ncbi:MAG: carbohydrate-binding domain-containing protein [Treponema sp.]|nr:carbohydrate-binding domain-containing protein [Treponema sp.]
MKIRKSFICVCGLSLALTAFFSSCAEDFKPRMTISIPEPERSFPQPLKIEPMDESVSLSGRKIVIAPKEEGRTYTLSGYYKGEIHLETKNTVLKLKNAFLENSSGKPALYAREKCEISSAKESENYIVSRGRSFMKRGAVDAKKDLILGGSGGLFIKGTVCHGVEAEDVKMKGSGGFYIEGSRRGSAISCKSFEAEEKKAFSAYLLNSKNGIKADKSINIKSGTFYLYDNSVALKTDIKKDSSKTRRGIKVSGGVFFIGGNKEFAITDDEGLDFDPASLVDEDNGGE